MEKTCKKCDTTRSLEDFRCDPRYRGGRRHTCKPCERAASLEWQKRHPERASKNKMDWAKRNPDAHARINLRARLKRYGTSEAEWVATIERQNGLCAICGQRCQLVPDHDHAGLFLRGALCSGCNTGLGNLGDNLEGLRRAVAYLTNGFHEGSPAALPGSLPVDQAQF